MLDLTIDAWYCWFGVAVVSVAVAGVAVELPSTAPPDAAAAVATIDAVAGATYPTTAVHPLDATAIRLDSDRLSLRNPGGKSHATVAFGPVVFAPAGSRLERVAAGAAPDTEFGDPADFEEAVARAETRSRTTGWRPVEDRLVVRRVHWGDVAVTLVAVGGTDWQDSGTGGRDA
ncbi:DUF7283 family protein [Haloarchaeobius sp. TZWWS8]|uniref:DUF7283 family protein n=1 Tax=Haloarchaeobius sp. TZWWS8 TaxID=3446121 RepID=UPI003EB8FED1